MAVDDKLIASNPVDGIKQKKLDKPIRQTPTLAQFQTIVDSIRAQKFANTAQKSADYVQFIGLAGLGRAGASALTWQVISGPMTSMSGTTWPRIDQLTRSLE
jgi:hypothetical protein